MNGTIKAIETRYKGYRFRSRLEARWAVFFDALGIEWEYEKEGFDLDDRGWYLPDFFLKPFPAWVEIKPGIPDRDAVHKCNALSRLSNTPVLLIAGNPYPGEHFVMVISEGLLWVAAPFVETLENDRYVLTVSDGKQRYFLQSNIRPDLLSAFGYARRARFEHGESGGAR